MKDINNDKILYNQFIEIKNSKLIFYLNRENELVIEFNGDCITIDYEQKDINAIKTLYYILSEQKFYISYTNKRYRTYLAECELDDPEELYKNDSGRNELLHEIELDDDDILDLFDKMKIKFEKLSIGK